MLYRYPVTAVQNNWLHRCIIEIVIKLHELVEIRARKPSWKGVVPTEHWDKLERRTGIRDRVGKYWNELKKLSKDDRDLVRNALIGQNKIKRLLCRKSDCLELDDLPVGIQQAAKDLFVFAFERLSDFEVRTWHYSAIYESTTNKVCPFCGIEAFAGPTAPSEDFDHYLPKSRYPFSAVNLWNLVPACASCNRQYKRDCNPLFKDGIRRSVFNPYSCSPATISLMRSVPFGAADGLNPLWKVDLIPQCEESETWDDIFHVRTRYERDVLYPHWKRWIDGFLKFSEKKGASGRDEIRQCISEWREILAVDGLNDMAFLKCAFFEMIQDQFDKGNEPLLRLLSVSDQ